jgi:hypothetical protein
MRFNQFVHIFLYKISVTLLKENLKTGATAKKARSNCVWRCQAQ